MVKVINTSANPSCQDYADVDLAQHPDFQWHPGIRFHPYDFLHYDQGGSNRPDDVGVTCRGRFLHRWAMELAWKRGIVGVSTLNRACEYTVQELMGDPCQWEACRPKAQREIERCVRFLADIGALPVCRIKPDVGGVKRYRIL